LTLGWKLLNGEKLFADAWNFGPNWENNVSVLNLVTKAKTIWDKIDFDFDKGLHPHEAGFLMLDSSKAIKLLNWRSVWGFNKTLGNTMKWYQAFYENNNVLTQDVLYDYINDAKSLEIEWSNY
jgi:CDP-glucose 4,6-dehydratase